MEDSSFTHVCLGSLFLYQPRTLHFFIESCLLILSNVPGDIDLSFVSHRVPLHPFLNCLTCVVFLNISSIRCHLKLFNSRYFSNRNISHISQDFLISNHLGLSVSLTATPNFLCFMLKYSHAFTIHPLWNNCNLST